MSRWTCPNGLPALPPWVDICSFCLLLSSRHHLGHSQQLLACVWDRGSSPALPRGDPSPFDPPCVFVVCSLGHLARNFSGDSKRHRANTMWNHKTKTYANLFSRSLSLLFPFIFSLCLSSPLSPTHLHHHRLKKLSEW